MGCRQRASEELRAPESLLGLHLGVSGGTGEDLCRGVAADAEVLRQKRLVRQRSRCRCDVPVDRDQPAFHVPVRAQQGEFARSGGEREGVHPGLRLLPRLNSEGVMQVLAGRDSAGPVQAHVTRPDRVGPDLPAIQDLVGAGPPENSRDAHELGRLRVSPLLLKSRKVEFGDAVGSHLGPPVVEADRSRLQVQRDTAVG